MRKQREKEIKKLATKRKNIAMRKQREKEIKKLATKIHCEKQDENESEV